MTQLLVWDLNTDQVDPGQWLKGAIYTESCDVTPDGRYLLGSYANYSWRSAGTEAPEPEIQLRTWTAISRPPYLNALAYWFSYDRGGFWESNTSLLATDSVSQLQGTRAPSIELKSIDRSMSEPESFRALRLQRSGWLHGHGLEPDCSLWTKVCRNGFVRLTQTREVESLELRDDFDRTIRGGQVWSAGSKLAKRKVRWFDADAEGNPIFAEDGCLWRWNSFPDGEPRKVANLDPNVFENVLPPEWALEW